jgi:hypothetical protein
VLPPKISRVGVDARARGKLSALLWLMFVPGVSSLIRLALPPRAWVIQVAVAPDDASTGAAPMRPRLRVSTMVAGPPARGMRRARSPPPLPASTTQ